MWIMLYNVQIVHLLDKILDISKIKRPRRDQCMTHVLYVGTPLPEEHTRVSFCRTENILVKGKHETGDQFFHRLEVCLFGTVSTLPTPADQTKTKTVSHIIISDYK